MITILYCNNRVPADREIQNGLNQVKNIKSAEDYNKIISDDYKKFVILVYWDDCGPCKRFKPSYYQIASKITKKYPSIYQFLQIERTVIDSDEDLRDQIFEKSKSKTYPLVLIIDEGEAIAIEEDKRPYLEQILHARKNYKKQKNYENENT